MRRVAHGPSTAAPARIEEAIRADLAKAQRRMQLLLIPIASLGAVGFVLGRAHDSPGLAWFGILAALTGALVALGATRGLVRRSSYC